MPKAATELILLFENFHGTCLLHLVKMGLLVLLILVIKK